MKKIIIVLSLVLALGMGSMFVYATEATPAVTEDNTEAKEWFEERMEFKKEKLDKALADGEISDEQFKTWSEHYEYMAEFHKENGFINGGGFGAGCNKEGRGSKGFGGMMRGGFGGGMMRNGNNGLNNN